MSQEAVPDRATPPHLVQQTAQSMQQSVPEQKSGGAPKGLLQQMEELMAALNADLNRLDAELQSSADRTPAPADDDTR
ncbi:hypothetical protein ABZO31_25705 [Streptomyces sp. HUAS MG47]|uniref:hypothetical protein n=1 Tax=Streptomyces solicamelliae TaxID=3231716 RepID=UPI003877B3EC